MSAPVSGQVTFGFMGTKNVFLGIPVNDLDIYGGSRTGTVETDGLESMGHADASNQFCRTSKDGRADKDSTHCLVLYNSSGVRVVEARVTGGWGTSTITFDCTIASASFPFDLVART